MNEPRAARIQDRSPGSVPAPEASREDLDVPSPARERGARFARRAGNLQRAGTGRQSGMLKRPGVARRVGTPERAGNGCRAGRMGPLLAGGTLVLFLAGDALGQRPVLSLRESDPRSAVSAEREYAARFSGDPAEVPAALALTETGAEDPPVRPPGLAFLFSAILPGAGQLYNGNNRGFVFLGIEAAAWFTRISYVDAGNKKEDEYHSFGLRHWDYDRFRDTAGGNACQWTAEADSLIRQNYETNRKQYFDDIGQVDAYLCGWDDVDPGSESAASAHRVEYRSLRRRTNDLRDNARLALGLLVVNRIVSAVDAFRTARSRKEAAGSDLRLESGLEGGARGPRAVLRLVKEVSW